jgi:hypothetical protein
VPKYNNDPRDVPEAGGYRITSPATAPFARATPPARARAIPSLDPRSLAPSTRALAPPPVRCSPPRASSRRASSRLARRSRAAGARWSRARLAVRPGAPPARTASAGARPGDGRTSSGTSTSRSTRTTGGSSPRAARRDGAAPRAATGAPPRAAGDSTTARIAAAAAAATSTTAGAAGALPRLEATTGSRYEPRARLTAPSRRRAVATRTPGPLSRAAREPAPGSGLERAPQT